MKFLLHRQLPPTVRPYGQPPRTVSSHVVPGRPRPKMKLQIHAPNEPYESVAELPQIKEEQITATDELFEVEETLQLKEAPINVLTEGFVGIDPKLEHLSEGELNLKDKDKKSFPRIVGSYPHTKKPVRGSLPSDMRKNITSQDDVTFPPITKNSSLVASNPNSLDGGHVPNSIPVQTSMAGLAQHR